MSVTVQIFDPAMCCSTGICGPSVDPQLVRFSADLEWLVDCGVSVVRFNLAQQPKAFADSAAAKQALESNGEAALPLIIVDGVVKSSGSYPWRGQLAAWTGLEAERCEPTDPTAGDAEPKASAQGCCGDAKQAKRCC